MHVGRFSFLTICHARAAGPALGAFSPLPRRGATL
jgi:hypothetical protein